LGNEVPQGDKSVESEDSQSKKKHEPIWFMRLETLPGDILNSAACTDIVINFRK
jgi:WD40 repeat protein